MKKEKRKRKRTIKTDRPRENKTSINTTERQKGKPHRKRMKDNAQTYRNKENKTYRQTERKTERQTERHTK